MADGYARASQKVAVVTAQNGPAAALLAPGLAEAYKASVPMVAIVQDVRRNQTDKNAFQELDHFDIFRGCSKWVRRVAEMSRIEDYVDMAFTAAASGRGQQWRWRRWLLRGGGGLVGSCPKGRPPTSTGK